MRTGLSQKQRGFRWLDQTIQLRWLIYQQLCIKRALHLGLERSRVWNALLGEILPRPQPTDWSQILSFRSMDFHLESHTLRMLKCILRGWTHRQRTYPGQGHMIRKRLLGKTVWSFHSNQESNQWMRPQETIRLQTAITQTGHWQNRTDSMQSLLGLGVEGV